MSNTIVLKTEAARSHEAIAAAALSPGHLLEIDSANKVKKHATEGGYSERLVAVEDALQGKTKTNAYSTDDRVFTYALVPGDEVQMLLKAGESVVIGDRLISSGAGELIEEGSEVSATTIKQIIAYAIAVLDLSASGTVATLTNVRIV